MRTRWTQAILCLTIVGLFFGWIRHADAQAQQDSQMLMNVAKPFMQTNPKIIFKYTSYFGKCNSENSKIIAAGESLSRELGFAHSNIEALPLQQAIYTVKSEVEPGAFMALTVASPAGQSSCYAVLRLDASGSLDQDHLLKWQEQMSTSLKNQSIQGIWNVIMQGISVPMSGNPKELLAELARVYKGKVVESYEDDATYSISLASQALDGFIMSGKNKVNIQIALHHDTTSGLWRLTVGTPIITMEY